MSEGSAAIGVRVEEVSKRFAHRVKGEVYAARDVSIDRASIHITLEDGTLAFTKDVAGRVTGAWALRAVG